LFLSFWYTNIKNKKYKKYYFDIFLNKNTLNHNLKHTVYNSWQLLMVMVTNTCVNFGINQPNLKDEKELYINITGNTTFHLKKK